MQRIHRQVEHLRVQYPQVRFACSTHFGFEQEIFELLEQRVADLRSGAPESGLACDGCRYREIAHDLGHGHSHEHTHANHVGQAREQGPTHEYALHVHGHESYAHHHGHAYEPQQATA